MSGKKEIKRAEANETKPKSTRPTFNVDEDREKVVEEGIDINGLTVDKNTDICVAYKRTWKGGEAFYVKRGRFGRDIGTLYNPFGATNTIDQLSHYRASRDLREFDYMVATKHCYENYVSFLKTKNMAYYREATRG